MRPLSLSEQLGWLAAYCESPAVVGRTDPLHRQLDTFVLACYDQGQIRLGVLAAWLGILGSVGLLTVLTQCVVEIAWRRADLRGLMLPRGYSPESTGPERGGR